jgi:hypothetical protein
VLVANVRGILASCRECCEKAEGCQCVKLSGQSTYLALIKSIYPHPVFLTYLISLCCFFLAVLFLSFYSTFSVYFSSHYFCVSFLKSTFLAAFLFIPVQLSLIYFIITYYPHLLHYSYFCLLYFYFPSFRFLCLLFSFHLILFIHLFHIIVLFFKTTYFKQCTMHALRNYNITNTIAS